jgi:hypothetical protein
MTETQDFAYDRDGLMLTGQIARPSGAGPHPGVLVMHSALGLDDLVCRRTRDLAALGYIALATDMYGVGQDRLRCVGGHQRCCPVSSQTLCHLPSSVLCANTTCLTSCHLRFVSISCHFFMGCRRCCDWQEPVALKITVVNS